MSTQRTIRLAGFLVTVAAASSCGDGSTHIQQPPPDTDVVIQADPPPPPISGGTLIVSNDQTMAYASDPDRDLVYLVSLQNRKLVNTIQLTSGDEPGRLVEDEAGRVHVVLRGAGSIATIAPGSTKPRITHACAAPRGIAHELGFGGSADLDVVHVACVGGDLVTLRADDGTELRRLHLQSDLRDVVVELAGVTNAPTHRLFVSRFRSAEILAVKGDGTVLPGVFKPRGSVFKNPRFFFQPEVAWRMLPRPEGGVAVLHQRAVVLPNPRPTPTDLPKYTIELGSNAYASGDCGGAIVHGTVAAFDGSVFDNADFTTSDVNENTTYGTYLNSAILTVDMAFMPPSGDPFKDMVAIVSAGTDELLRIPWGLFQSNDLCGGNLYQSKTSSFRQQLTGLQPTAVATYSATNQFVVQSREPAALVIVDAINSSSISPIILSDKSRKDTGHDLFHRQPPGVEAGVLACASCHAEGGDDGQTRFFTGDDPVKNGYRRTQNLRGRGHLLETAPFHWGGDLKDMNDLVNDTFVQRMGGQPIGPKQTAALGRWIQSIPLIPNEDVDPIRKAHGLQIFESEQVACTVCHKGAMFTSNENKDIQKTNGGKLQIPSLLGVGLRAPYMSDGCATTLLERFTNPDCGGQNHGDISGLTGPDDLNDLIVYLNSL